MLVTKIWDTKLLIFKNPPFIDNNPLPRELKKCCFQICLPGVLMTCLFPGYKVSPLWSLLHIYISLLSYNCLINKYWRGFVFYVNQIFVNLQKVPMKDMFPNMVIKLVRPPELSSTDFTLMDESGCTFHFTRINLSGREFFQTLRLSSNLTLET